MIVSTKGKVFGFAILAVALFFAVRYYQGKPKDVAELKTVGKVSIPDAPEASLSGTAAVKLPNPSDKLSAKEATEVDWLMMAWQSQNAHLGANGGAKTTQGSLYESAGWSVNIIRQDDCMQSCSELVKNCKELKEGKTKKGVFITFMGSGIPNYFTSVYNSTKELGPEYQPICFMTSGKSYGEDQVVGSEEFKADKTKLKGKILHGVRLDGDIDLALKLCADADIKINPDEKLWFADALNLSYATTFLTAVNDYNNLALKQKRKIVRDGKTQGDTLIGIDLVATWTPGDVNAHNGRGGVTIISTKEYASIMPNITMACKKFLNDNRDKVVNLIAATAQEGDQIRSFSDVKKYVSTLSAKVWNENTADYWLKYYDGVTLDKNTHLGGSMVFNLKDMAYILGLDGTRDSYKDIYNTFGKLQSGYYPKDLPEVIDYSKVFDKSFTRSVMDNHPELLEGKLLKVDYTQNTNEVVGSKSYTIEFNSNSSEILSADFKVLEDIAQSISTADGLKVLVEGHTDNTGNSDANMTLSNNRAASVKNYLIGKKIDAERFDSKGYGDTKPVADNSTKAGQRKNRRVTITLTK